MRSLPSRRERVALVLLKVAEHLLLQGIPAFEQVAVFFLLNFKQMLFS